MSKSIAHDAYQSFVAEVVRLVQNHQVKAIQAVQTISNQLYWDIGELILNKQLENGWGNSIVEQLSKDLSSAIGAGISWSPRNLWFMRQLVSEYSNLNQLGSDLAEIKQLVSEVPWKHNILILQKVKDAKARIFYLQTTIKNRYSRAVLQHQIMADAYSSH
jgi:predicted nuclease of restriction endonuclease-like (RecB) superfamily